LTWRSYQATRAPYTRGCTPSQARGDGAGTFHCWTVWLGWSHRLATVELMLLICSEAATPGLGDSQSRARTAALHALTGLEARATFSAHRMTSLALSYMV
jgi:hypothetical protein